MVYTALPQDFVLTHLVSEVQLDLSGSMTSESIPTIDASAIAVLWMNVNAVKDTFQYQTDSLDVNDVNASDIKYYVFDSSFTELNPADASVLDASGGSGAMATASSNGDLYPADVMLVKDDFVRYLAKKLFNTTFGVDLFSNEDDLKSNVETACGSGAAGNTWYDVKSKLAAVGATNNALAGPDAQSHYYSTNGSTGTSNLSRELLLQLIGADVGRFQNVQHTDTPQPIPFVAGDSISFKLTIKPAEDQELLTGVPAFSEGHIYQIKIVMV